MAELNGGARQSQVIVFGGTGGGGLLFNDVFSYGLTTKTWEAVPCDGTPPAPRYGHTAELIPSRTKSRHHHHHHQASGNQQPLPDGGRLSPHGRFRRSHARGVRADVLPRYPGPRLVHAHVV